MLSGRNRLECRELGNLNEEDVKEVYMDTTQEEDESKAEEEEEKQTPEGVPSWKEDVLEEIPAPFFVESAPAITEAEKQTN